VGRGEAKRGIAIPIPSLHNGVSTQPPHVRLENQVGGATNAAFSVVDGCSRRPGTWWAGDVNYGGATEAQEDFKLHPIVRDPTEKYLVVYGSSALGVSEIDPITKVASACTVNVTAAALAYLNLNKPTPSATPYADERLRMVTVADTTFILNTTAALIERSGQVASASVAVATVLTTSTAHGLATGDSIYVEGMNTVPDIDGRFGGYPVTVLSATTFSIPVQVTAPGLAITSNTAANPTVVTTAAHGFTTGQTVNITGQSGVVSINGQRVVTVLTATTFTVPVDCTGGAGTGGFAATLGTWADNQPLASRLPVKMTRTTPRIGATPAVFDVDLIAWNGRESGTPTTNPFPTIFRRGHAIHDIRLWNDRLVIVGSDRVVMSQSGQYFQFFAADATNLVDSDPIDVGVPSDDAGSLDFMVPIRKSLFLYSDTGRQFELAAENGASQANVVITPTTSYATGQVRPAVMDPSIFFYADGGLLEYVYDELSLPSVAQDMSVHARGLIKTTGNERIKRLAVSDDTGHVVMLLVGSPAHLQRGANVFVYRRHDLNGDRVQSAWTRWRFGTEVDQIIYDVAVIGTDLWLLTGDDLERVPLRPEVLG